MLILVLGSEGSLMQSVIPKLLKQGHEVVGVDNLFRYGERRESAKLLSYKYVDYDLAKPWEDCFDIPERPDIIIQAAARIFGVAGFHKYESDILNFDLQIQQNAIRHALHWIGAKRPHIVYISSSMVYETCGDIDGGVTEDLPEKFPPCKTGYGLSKYVGERMIQAAHDQYGLNYTIWRPFNIITPHEPADKQEIGISHVFADFIENIVIQQKNPLPIIGDGAQIRCFTWIEDISDAIADNLNNPNAKNQTFNLGNPEPLTMMALANIIYNLGRALGLMPDTNLNLQFVTVKEYVDDVRVRIPNVDKARRTLLWEPTKNTNDSVLACLQFLLDKQKNL